VSTQTDPTEEFELSELAVYADKILKSTNNSVFLTGRAGTGKSTFLRKLCGEIIKQFVVLAPTGIAAIQVRGETIHSFFKLPLGPIPPGDDRLEKIKYTKEKIKLISTLDLLIIDEISMVRSDMLDAIDYCLRRIRATPKPFGGVQVLFVGDLLQLEPVTPHNDWERLEAYYTGPWFFQSQVIAEIDLVNIELEKVYRQTSPEFISLLDKIRAGAHSYEDMVVLNRLPSKPPHHESSYIITLTGTRKAAADTNNLKLSELAPDPKTYKGKLTGNFPHLPAEERLVLKKGAQVIFIKNDGLPFKRWVNGTLGMIEELDEDLVRVRTPDGKLLTTGATSWENIKYSVDKKGKIKEEIVGTFSQLPLRLAWAVTIHKSQGLTFDKVSIDMGRGAFAAGQLYVALSRSRTMEGIFLRNRLKHKDVITSPEVLAYYDKMNDLGFIQRILDTE
jgi:ATP-dependent exoDNAse (exonuclease V) alpha subunit